VEVGDVGGVLESVVQVSEVELAFNAWASLDSDGILVFVVKCHSLVVNWVDNSGGDGSVISSLLFVLVPLVSDTVAEAAWVAEDVLSSWVDNCINEIQFS